MAFLYDVFVLPLLYLFEIFRALFLFFSSNPITTIGIIGFVFALKYISKNILYALIFLTFCAIYFIMHALGFVLQKDALLLWVQAGVILETIFFCHQAFIKNTDFVPSIKSFCLCLLLMFVVFGIYLPLGLIMSAPMDFYTTADLKDLWIAEGCIGFGLFFIYPLIIFCILKKYRKTIFWLAWGLCLIFMVSTFVFKAPNSALNLLMQFEEPPTFSVFDYALVSTLYIICSIFISSYIMRYQRIKHFNLFMAALLFSYVLSTANGLTSFYKLLNHLKNESTSQFNVSLSSQQKNVLIIFLDRAISGFFPLITEEKPELKSELTGFVYYPYTVSFAPSTLYSAPSLFGGYQYTPLKLQNDTKRRMVDKHNESITLLPEAFRKSGYRVSLFGMPYINYDDFEKERFYHSDIELIDTKNSDFRYHGLLKTNMMWFVIFRIVPPIFKGAIYNNGAYLTGNTWGDFLRFFAFGEYQKFESFIQNVTLDDAPSGEFCIFMSLLTHSPTELSEDYQFLNNSDTPKEQKSKTLRYANHYNVNMLAYMEIIKLIKKLKQNGVYNNTKIIIMSDHGYLIDDIDHVKPEITRNNSLLLVKDFNANGDLRTDTTFMTSADVPYLATYHAVSDKYNPFDLKETIKEKNKGVDIIQKPLSKCSPAWFKDKNRTYLYDEDAVYLHVDENNIKEMIKFEGGEIKK